MLGLSLSSKSPPPKEKIRMAPFLLPLEHFIQFEKTVPNPHNYF